MYTIASTSKPCVFLYKLIDINGFNVYATIHCDALEQTHSSSSANDPNICMRFNQFRSNGSYSPDLAAEPHGSMQRPPFVE